MLLSWVLSLSAVASAAPWIRSQTGSRETPTRRALEAAGSVRKADSDRGPRQFGDHGVSLDADGHAALSDLIPVVSPHVAGGMATEVNVFVEANSGKQLSRGSAGTPLTSADGTPDISDSPLVWTDHKGYAAQWTLIGSSDGSGVFIKCASDRYLIDNDGRVQISEQHNGPWTLQAASQGRVTLKSAEGNFLKEDDGAEEPVVLVGADEGDVTLFTVLMKDVTFQSGPTTYQVSDDSTTDEARTNSSKITVFIIGKENGGHLKENDDNSLDLKGDWLEPSTWTILDGGYGNVYIASNRGYYLRDNDGTLQLDIMDDSAENKKWSLNYEGHAMISVRSSAQKYLEDDDEILQMSVLNNDTLPGPRNEAMFTIQLHSISLMS